MYSCLNLNIHFFSKNYYDFNFPNISFSALHLGIIFIQKCNNLRIFWFAKWFYIFFLASFFKNYYQMDFDFRRDAFSLSSCKTKGERGPRAFGKGIVLPFVKRSPSAFGFCVWWVWASCLREKMGFCFFWPSKERDSFF
jgi:hypothetical protein